MRTHRSVSICLATAYHWTLFAALFLGCSKDTPSDHSPRGTETRIAGDQGDKPETRVPTDSEATTDGGALPDVTPPPPDTRTTTPDMKANDTAPSLPDTRPSLPTVTLLTASSCSTPCTFSVSVTGAVESVEYDADGWPLGSSSLPPDFTITASFNTLGDRLITATALNSAGDPLATSSLTVTVSAGATPPPDCLSYDSQEEEYAPVQVVAAGTPPNGADVSWTHPTQWTYFAPFAGTPGQAAQHEGLDYVHNDTDVSEVLIEAAADGEVVYVRSGCPQSSLFAFNTALRECGSGWGNHIVLRHPNETYTRYAHLLPSSITVKNGQMVLKGDPMAVMGNTGRSDVRHLHLELGTHPDGFDPCTPSQSMALIFDPALTIGE